MHSIRRVASCTTVLLLAIAWALAPRAPAIAQSAAARKVLDAVAARSKAHGTPVRIDGSVGSMEMDIGAASSQQVPR